jgi:hypothetical protein
VEEIVPDEPTVTVLVKVELLVLTSKPVGGVTRIPACIFAPDTLKLVDEDAVPLVVLKAEGVPLFDITGTAETVLDGIASVTEVAPPPLIVTLPE